MPDRDLPLPGECSAESRSDPFPYGWIDGFLDDDHYRSLEQAFVSPDTHPELDVLGKGKKRILFHVPPVPAELGVIEPVWRTFLEGLSAPAYRAHCLAWLADLLPLNRMPEGPYRDLARLRGALRPDQVEFQCEFSGMDGGVHLPPHTDSTDKLISFVLYFAPTDWREEWGGATETYRPKDSTHARNWSNFLLQRDQMEVVGKSVFRANRLFFFVKTENSWHGLAPIDLAASSSRRSFNFSLRIRRDFPLDPAIGRIQAQIRQLEQAVFQP